MALLRRLRIPGCTGNAKLVDLCDAHIAAMKLTALIHDQIGI
jgi:hypothetical protein